MHGIAVNGYVEHTCWNAGSRVSISSGAECYVAVLNLAVSDRCRPWPNPDSHSSIDDITFNFQIQNHRTNRLRGIGWVAIEPDSPSARRIRSGSKADRQYGNHQQSAF